MSDDETLERAARAARSAFLLEDVWDDIGEESKREWREVAQAVIDSLPVRPSTGKAEPPTPFEPAPANVTQLAPKRE